jgi:Protein of unknown function (DUF2911)
MGKIGSWFLALAVSPGKTRCIRLLPRAKNQQATTAFGCYIIAVRNSAMRAFLPPLAVVVMAASGCLAQDQTAYCNYEDGNQVSMQYHAAVKEELRNGHVWSPGITLFVQVPLTLGGSEIPLGAYTVYLIPGGKSWTLIVNRNVTAGAPYNSAQDVARAPMEVGEIPDPTKELELSFAHMSAKQCSLRVYYQKTGAFTDFLEKN